MNTFRSHKPNYMTGFDEPSTKFETKEQLLSDPQLVRFAKNEDFKRFSATDRRKCIMAEMIDDKFWVMGFCKEQVPGDWFPRWVSPSEKNPYIPKPKEVKKEITFANVVKQ